MSVTFDSNVLVYAFDDAAGRKHERARALIYEARDSSLILTAQALGEFLNVVRRKMPQHQDIVRDQADRLCALFPIIPTRAADMIRGADFARRHSLQYWDSVIWQVASAAGATALISEDMQDGLVLDGMMVINPFNAANDELVSLLLAETRSKD